MKEIKQVEEDIYLLKKRLDEEVKNRNSYDEVSSENPDPILIARKYKDEYISFVCAFFAYGNVKQIIKFLSSLDMSLIDADEDLIREKLKEHYYRFQNSEDVIQFFITLSRLKKQNSLEDIFMQGYKENSDVIDGINAVITQMYKVNSYNSRGYQFLIGKITTKRKGVGALKRWNMYLRWMVRKDEIDMGLWSNINKKDLILPLDTHTFNVGLKLGLLKRKTYDLEAAWQMTQTLKSFDETDPVKYDFAIYRLGQEKVLHLQKRLFSQVL